MEIPEENETTERPSFNEESIEELIEPEEYISRIGECGLFQIRTQIIFMLFTILITAQIFIPYYVMHDPPWRCKQNATVCPFASEIKPHDTRNFLLRCNYPRHEWEFSRPRKYSLVTHFDLVCDRRHIALLASSILFIGWCVGGLVLSYVADTIGRKKTCFSCVITMSIAGGLSVAIQHPYAFIASRAIIGFCLGGGGVIIFVMSAEIVGPKYRALSCTMIWIYFTMAMVYLTGMAYIFQDWRWLELSVCAPILLVLLTWVYFPESIRWLRVKGRLHEAETLLRSIALTNRAPLPNARLKPETSPGNGHANYKHMFNRVPMFIQTFIQLFTWFFTGLLYFCLTFSSQDLSGRFYSDFVLTSVAEIPGNIAVIVFCNKFGRKGTIISHMLLTSICCITLAYIPLQEANAVYKYARLWVGIVGKYAITCQINSMYIWSAELHPTVLRTQAVGLMVGISRLGAAFVPSLLTIVKYYNPALPFVIMACGNALCALMCFKLQETKGRPTPDTLEEKLLQLGAGRKLNNVEKSLDFIK